MAEDLRLICAGADLLDAGKGVRFVVQRHGRSIPAFVIRFRGVVYGYFNECGHIPVELDWVGGEFFDDSKLYLICSVHGALYAPESGRCLGGRCHGKGLKPLPVCEIDQQIYLKLDKNDG
ncbi:MAG: Rieske (2Fe-2S) protein [Rhodocyclales bacterium GT-UBC]|nr:MAG: Rieske (2Fe-2S) protein [Rhodocyclales bacterium GT-UBC]